MRSFVVVVLSQQHLSAHKDPQQELASALTVVLSWVQGKCITGGCNFIEG